MSKYTFLIDADSFAVAIPLLDAGLWKHARVTATLSGMVLSNQIDSDHSVVDVVLGSAPFISPVDVDYIVTSPANRANWNDVKGQVIDLTEFARIIRRVVQDVSEAASSESFVRRGFEESGKDSPPALSNDAKFERTVKGSKFSAVGSTPSAKFGPTDESKIRVGSVSTSLKGEDPTDDSDEEEEEGYI